MEWWTTLITEYRWLPDSVWACVVGLGAVVAVLALCANRKTWKFVWGFAAFGLLGAGVCGMGSQGWSTSKGYSHEWSGLLSLDPREIAYYVERRGRVDSPQAVAQPLAAYQMAPVPSRVRKWAERLKADGATPSELEQLARTIPPVVDAEAVPTMCYNALREARAEGPLPSRDEAVAWLDVAQRHLRREDSAGTLSAALPELRLSWTEGEVSLHQPMLSGELIVPPTMEAGMVIDSVEWRTDEGPWQLWPVSFPMPANSGHLWMMVRYAPPAPDFEVRVLGKVVIYSEFFQDLIVKAPFELRADGSVPP